MWLPRLLSGLQSEPSSAIIAANNEPENDTIGQDKVV